MDALVPECFEYRDVSANVAYASTYHNQGNDRTYAIVLTVSPMIAAWADDMRTSRLTFEAITSAVTFRFTQAVVTRKAPSRKKAVVIFTGSADDGDRLERVRSVNLTAVSQSPDGLCVATVGIANRYLHYKG